MHHQQQIHQMQMQRQAIANVHSSASAGYSSVPGAPPSNSGVPQYTPQQLAAAAANAGLTNTASSSSSNVPSGNQSVNSQNIRAYLDQTVVPILLDGERF